MPGPSFRPTEEARQLLCTKVYTDPRKLIGVAKLVGISAPSLSEFLNTPGSGSKVFPLLCALYGVDPFENRGLDDDQRELLRILELARANGRDSAALVAAFRTLVTGDSPKARP